MVKKETKMYFAVRTEWAKSKVETELSHSPNLRVDSILQFHLDLGARANILT